LALALFTGKRRARKKHFQQPPLPPLLTAQIGGLFVDGPLFGLAPLKASRMHVKRVVEGIRILARPGLSDRFGRKHAGFVRFAFRKQLHGQLARRADRCCDIA
jgi:hypothetical protein